MRNPNDGKGSRTTPTDPVRRKGFVMTFIWAHPTLSIFLLCARGLSFGSNTSSVVLWAVSALALIDPPNATNCFSLLQLKCYAHWQWGTTSSAGKHQWLFLTWKRGIRSSPHCFKRVLPYILGILCRQARSWSFFLDSIWSSATKFKKNVF